MDVSLNCYVDVKVDMNNIKEVSIWIKDKKKKTNNLGKIIKKKWIFS